MVRAWSNAPCLHKGVQKCWDSIIPGTGYCKWHQPVPFAGAVREVIPGWTRLRAQVLQRDKQVCYLCGGPGADEVDHILPVSEGGSSKPYNLAAVHGSVAPYCHRDKTAQQTAAHKKSINTIKIRGKKYD